MSLATETLQNRLAHHIQKWIDKECELQEWDELNVYTHPELANDMAKSAFAILDVIAKSQNFAIEQGYLNT